MSPPPIPSLPPPPTHPHAPPRHLVPHPQPLFRPPPPPPTSQNPQAYTYLRRCCVVGTYQTTAPAPPTPAHVPASYQSTICPPFPPPPPTVPYPLLHHPAPTPASDGAKIHTRKMHLCALGWHTRPVGTDSLTAPCTTNAGPCACQVSPCPPTCLPAPPPPTHPQHTLISPHTHFATPARHTRPPLLAKTHVISPHPTLQPLTNKNKAKQAHLRH